MTRSMLILSALVVAAVAAGCSSDVVPKAEKLADRACACESAECAEEVNADVEGFLREATGKKLDEKDEEKLTKAANRIGTCLAEHIGADALPSDEGGASGHSFEPEHDRGNGDHDHGDHDHEH